ncbi:MAG: UTP--glucose-phosphate uridylyltransferase [Bacillales bacterium]|nr:UTP--glucose-phosphate uridylyltransferase [Bacillales bacterium]
MKLRKAIIPAAGLGTRFLPATKAQPKEMLPIVDKPTLQYIIEEAVKSGIEEILSTTFDKKNLKDLVMQYIVQRVLSVMNHSQ